MNYRSDEPDCETRNHSDAERDVFLETDKGGDIKKNTRDNSPNCTCRVFLHKGVVAGSVTPEPDQDNQTCQRHCGNKPSRMGVFFPDMDTDEDNADGCCKF